MNSKGSGGSGHHGDANSGNSATVSLVLGAVALLTSPFLIGGLLGVIGMALGMSTVRETQRWQPGPHVDRARRKAHWGAGLSAAAMAVAAAALVITMALSGGLPSLAGSGALASWEQVAAPELAMTTLDGERISLEELRGKRVVLNFWATWCGPCRRELPDLIELANERSADELVILGISDEPVETLRRFVEKEGINYPVISIDAGSLPSPYRDIRTIPTNIILDRNGVIQYVRGLSTHKSLTKLLDSPDHEGAAKPAPAG